MGTTPPTDRDGPPLSRRRRRIVKGLTIQIRWRGRAHRGASRIARREDPPVPPRGLSGNRGAALEGPAHRSVPGEPAAEGPCPSRYRRTGGAAGQDVCPPPAPRPLVLRIQGIPEETVQAVRGAAQGIHGCPGADVRMIASEPFLRDIWDRLARGDVR